MVPRDPKETHGKDPRTTEQLVAAYLSDPESEDGFHALAVVHYRGEAEEYAVGERLARGATERERVAGADVLAQLGWGERTYLEESVSILLDLLRDPSEEVVAAAAIALGHRNHPRAIPALVELADHRNADVRYGVVHGLSGHDDLDAAGALIRLMDDSDRDVRDWATFGLARTDLDSLPIREALFARTGDDDAEVRGEALIGLAARGDPRALPLVRQELSGEFFGDWAIEAAELLADPSLHPVLEDLQRRLDPEERSSTFDWFLAEALEACKPKP